MHIKKISLFLFLIYYLLMPLPSISIADDFTDQSIGGIINVLTGPTTAILVGGGNAPAKPVWTTATGTGSPVMATSPTLITPNITTSITTPAIIAPTSSSLVIKPTTNDTDAVQVQNAAGTTSILNVDTTNNRVGIGTASPGAKLHVAGGAIKVDNTYGIDFSANTNDYGTPAAGAEVLDDYEEGTWTPNYSAATDFESITYDTAITGGWYVKIGSVVYITGSIRTDAITMGSAAGDTFIGGLPFTVKSFGTGYSYISNSVSISQVGAFAGDMPESGSISATTDKIALKYRSAANGATMSLAVSDFATGANSNYVGFSGFYVAD